MWPKGPIQIVVWVEEGNTGVRSSQQAQQASTRLRIFQIFRSLARKFKIACWDIPNPYRETEDPHGKPKTEYQMKFYVHGGGKTAHRRRKWPATHTQIWRYLRKMAIDGYIIYTDTADIKAFTKELSAIGRNINQIAKRINAGGPAYQADMDEIRERLDEIWQLQRHILSSQR